MPNHIHTLIDSMGPMISINSVSIVGHFPNRAEPENMLTNLGHNFWCPFWLAAAVVLRKLAPVRIEQRWCPAVSCTELLLRQRREKHVKVCEESA